MHRRIPYHAIAGAVFFAAVSAAAQNGWIATYTADGVTVREAVPAPNFYLSPGESIHPAIGPQFRAEWQGQLTVLRGGDYEFDPPLTIGTSAGTRFRLTAGVHPARLSFASSAPVRAQRLRWRSDHFDWEPVPASALSHEPALTPDPSIARGRELVRKLGCGNCHGSAAARRPLDGIGSRATAAWLHHFLGNHAVPLEDARRADAAAYLTSLRAATEPAAKRASEVDVGKGGELFGTLGCGSCHAPRSRGIRSAGSKYGYAALAGYLANGHQPSLLLDGAEAIALAASLVRSTDPAVPAAAPAGDSARGRAVVQNSGCLGCHSIRGLSSTAPRAPALASVRGASCKATSHDLTAAEWQSIRSYLAGPPDRYPAPTFELRLALNEQGCNACHQHGAEAPSLDGVGEKLKTSWIAGVISGGERIRTGRELRMPSYAPGVIDAEAFAKAEGLAPGDGPAPPAFTAPDRDSGLGLIGTDPATRGMGCIGCHDWGTNKSLGEEGPQLINVTERMRFDWYERWMRNPARILSGTSMPNYFGAMPRDRAMPRIHALWAGMELGPRGSTPAGYRASAPDAEAKPVPDKEAIVIRWDMPGATPAAIAVGLPGGLSYCFDAGRVQLLYSWRGGFVDMSETLFKKVDKEKLTPTATLVGDVTWRASGFPWRSGSANHTPKARFRGYRLAGGVPEFRYEIDGVEIREKLTADGKALRRSLTLSGNDRPLWFEGREIAPGTKTFEMVIGQ